MHGALIGLALLATLAPQEGAPAPAAPKTTPVRSETLERPAGGIAMTAEYYVRRGNTGPLAVCLHMADSSRGEYAKSAAEFVLYGASVLAVDLRAGKEHDGVLNATAAAFHAKHKRAATFAEAYDDVVEAVKWARELRPDAKILLVGSSYSATLALAYAARVPDGVDSVIAISPSECIEGWTVAAEVRNIKVPTHIQCGSGIEERTKAQRFFNGLDKKLRSSFYAPEELKVVHGAPMLWHEDPLMRTRVWNMPYKMIQALTPAAASEVGK